MEFLSHPFVAAHSDRSHHFYLHFPSFLFAENLLMLLFFLLLLLVAEVVLVVGSRVLTVLVSTALKRETKKVLMLPTIVLATAVEVPVSLADLPLLMTVTMQKVLAAAVVVADHLSVERL